MSKKESSENNRQSSFLLFTGNIQKPTDDGKGIRVGSIRLFEVRSANSKAPYMSGEIRVLDRFYKVALWRTE